MNENDIIENRRIIQETKDLLAQFLKYCNEERTPYVYKLKSTPEGYKKVEDFVLRVCFGSGQKVSDVIMKLERQLDPNYIDD